MIRKIKNILHKIIAISSNIIFAFPAKNLYVIGVTGTDGKSTTAYYLYQILTLAGKKAAFIGTTGAIINQIETPLGLHVTTPTSYNLQKLIKKVKQSGAKYLVLEVTSHGLDQHRIWGIPFQIGILTNITPEHLDYHKTFENYVKTKARLLNLSKTVLVTGDNNKSLDKYLKNKKRVYYGQKEKSQSVNKKFDLPENLTDYNRKNMLGAITAARRVGLTDEEIKNVLPKLKLPKARLDTVYSKNFKVIIDFAHTPAAFKSLLPELRKDTKGRIIHVFGSAGERDSEKRELMGKIASKYDDMIILTSEDPRNEEIEKINEDLKKEIKGFEKSQKNEKSDNHKKIYEIPDRKSAIKNAINLAEKGDLVLLTGKGHEKSLNIKGREIPWDEYKAVEEAIIQK